MITVNGKELDIAADVTMRQLLLQLSMPERGIAVAVDGTVLPKSRWDATTVEKGSTIEILTAVQGG
ncbi:sulfur carrier protein ThiS [Rhodococcus sovatensis]|uniref:Sulfur carrier protein ThiS n=1 Tax=Rhodococcus sovatensis TaxID=1805840 RepID=A0ABZ2PEB8_9NOCA